MGPEAAGVAVYYFVIGIDGQRYGPVDVDGLVAWVGEGRIVASTVLIERGTDRSLAAESLPAVAAAIARINSGSAPSPTPVIIERGLDETRTAAGPPTAKPAAFAPGMPMAGAPGMPPPVPMMPVAGQMPAVPVMLPYGVGYKPQKSKIAAGLLGLFLGCFGIHRFYLGHTGIGIVQLLLTVLTCGYGSLITAPWALVEAILCFTGTLRDADGRELRD